MKKPSYVSAVFPDRKQICVRLYDQTSRRLVEQLGGRRKLLSLSEWKIFYKDDRDLAQILVDLRDNSILFSAGKEWSPSEVFEHLRDRGMVRGKYSIIYWERPGKFNIYSK